MTFEKFNHREEDPKSVWLHYYSDISPPSVIISGDNKIVTASDNKCFTYICNYINIQDRAVKFENTKDYSILLCENSFIKGPGTIYISSSYKNDIIVDKFCSFESISPSNGAFTYFYGNVNSTILQGSISNGGDSSVERGMIYQDNGFAILSYSNISQCISKYTPAFFYYTQSTTTKVSFCNLENIKASQSMITQIQEVNGRIERCNYINNSKDNSIYGLVVENTLRLDILDSIFQKNLQNKIKPLFYSHNGGQIHIYRCLIDDYSAVNAVYTSEMTTSSFSNDLKFIGFSPCEGELTIERNQDKKYYSSCFSNYFFFAKYFLSFWLIS